MTLLWAFSSLGLSACRVSFNKDNSHRRYCILSHWLIGYSVFDCLRWREYWTGQPSTYNSMLAEEPQCFSELSRQSHLQPLSMPKSQTVITVFDPTYAFTNYGLRIPLSIYTVLGWEVLDAPSFSFTLRAEKLENIQAQFIVNSPNLEDYDHLKIALLVDFVTTESSTSMGILLGYKDGRYKRIPTTKHIILSRLTEPTAPETIFIE